MLPESLFVWSRAHLETEVEIDDILSASGREKLLNLLGERSLFLGKPMGEPLTLSNRRSILRTWFQNKTCDLIFGSWDVEQEYIDGDCVVMDCLSVH